MLGGWPPTPATLVCIAPGFFIAANEGDFVFRVEVVVDPKIVLIAIDDVSIPVGQVQTFDTPDEPNTCSVEAVAYREIVRSRHSGERFLHVCAVIKCRPQWIPAEHADGLQRSGRAARDRKSVV